MENFHAVCHARTMFYPGDAYPFLEAVLSIPEKLRGLARKCPEGGRRPQHTCSNGRRPATEPALAARALPNSDKT
jgi:hypothetical protein